MLPDLGARPLAARRLAGDARAGSWTRGQLRHEQWNFVRRAWAQLAGLLSVAVAGTVGISFLVPVAYWRGFVVGAGAAGTLAALAVLVLQVTGSAHRAMGATAEQWTAGELRRLTRHGWTLINHFLLDNRGDIDHLLIGPTGVYVVETKWSTDWRLDRPDERLVGHVQKLQSRRGVVQNWVGRSKVPVQPVLFLWGPLRERQQRPDQPMRLDGVTVIHGQAAARAWLSEVASADPAVTTDVRLDVEAKALRQLRSREDYEARKAPTAPPSLLSIYWTATGCLVAGCASLIVGLEAGAHLIAGWSIPILAVMAAIGLPARRSKRLRLAADIWITCSAVLLVLMVISRAAL